MVLTALMVLLGPRDRKDPLDLLVLTVLMVQSDHRDPKDL